MNRTNNRSGPPPSGFWRLPALLLPVVLLFCCACGRKDLPVPPDAHRPAAVNDFHAELIDGQVVLSWTLPAMDQNRQLSGGVIRMFQAGRSLSAIDECPECPPSFVRVADYPIRNMRPNEAGRLEGVYRQAVEPGYQYWYYVVIRSVDGVDGPSSYVVDVTCSRKDR